MLGLKPVISVQIGYGVMAVRLRQQTAYTARRIAIVTIGPQQEGVKRAR